MANNNGLHFTFSINGLEEASFSVVDFTLDEGLSRLYKLEIALLSKRGDWPLAELLDRGCCLQIWLNGEVKREVVGIVAGLSQGDSGFRRTAYQVEVRPPLWRMTLGRDSRIYQQQSVPEVIKALMIQHHLRYELRLQDNHQRRDYITQKRESDYDFLCRLAAEEGIFFWTESQSGQNLVKLVDASDCLSAGTEIVYNSHPNSLERGELISAFHLQQRVGVTDVHLKDRNHRNPNYRLMHQAVPDETGVPNTGISGSLITAQPNYQYYDSYGRFQYDNVGAPFSGYRLEQLRSDTAQGQGESNTPNLRPGSFFKLMEHSNEVFNQCWQVVSVVHCGQQGQAAEEESGEGLTTLNNRFSFRPLENCWRAPLMAKPTADGVEVATVTGPVGEEIYVNEEGAVKVWFHWDRGPYSDDRSSCWLRVAQSLSGSGFGSVILPRVGQEVIVSYLNGDIDRPIITGCLYNGINRPAYPLPANKTKTVLRTKTHKGEGFNEISFEDNRGQEQIYLHAERDFVGQVGNDAHWHIKNDKKERIDNNRIAAVKVDDNLTVEGAKRESVKNDYSLNVGKTLFFKPGKAHVIDAGEKLLIRSGVDVVVEAGAGLTLKAGGNFIKIDPANICSSQPIKVGGVPGVIAAEPFLPPVRPEFLSSLKMAALTGTVIIPVCGIQHDGNCTRGDCTCIKFKA